MLWWLALTGCQEDLLLAMGDITGVVGAAERGRAAPPPAEQEIAFEAPAEQPPIVSVPLEGDGTGVGGGARERAPRAAGAASTDRREFNPISVPQGPLEGTGVRFEGVSSRGASPAAMRGPGAINEFRKRR